MAIAGLRGTGDWGTDERPKNFREMILWRDPNGQTPIFALSARMKKESTSDPEFSWWEEELKPVRLQVTTAVTTSQTTVAIDLGDAQDLVAGDLLLVEGTETAAYANEIVTVASVQSATAFTITRGTANTTPATIADNAFLTRIGNAFAEGTTSPSASTRNPTKFYNYTQIFKTTYELTNTAKNTTARTGDPEQNDKKRKMFDHSAMVEYSIIFGKKYETTGSNGKPLRYTGGLMEALAASYAAGNTHCMTIWTTTPTEDEFINAVSKVWDYNAGGAGNERLMFCGNGFLTSLNRLARDSSSTRVNFDGTIKTYGMDLQKWVMPQGTVYARTHPLLNSHGRYTNSAFVLNPSGIIYRPLKGRDTMFKDNIQANDADTKRGMWIGELGYEFHHLKTMCYLGNFIK